MIRIVHPYFKRIEIEALDALLGKDHKKRVVFEAIEPLACIECRSEIEPGEVFLMKHPTSRTPQPWCGNCRPFRVRGNSAGIDDRRRASTIQQRAAYLARQQQEEEART